jgi:DegV family protein with EDD domain
MNMKKFVIITDSCSDLGKEMREKYNIDYVPMHFSYDGKDVVASLDFEEISVTDFYDMMRNGTRFLTSQVNAIDYKEKFEKYINEGYDILSISCSSALSASVKASYTVRDELLEKYPDSKIICIDSLNSCSGLALLCKMASTLREQGKSIDEVANWISENKKKVNQEATVEKLTYLKQAGRISSASAFFGGILNVKPIIVSDVNGQNASIEKLKGKKVAYARIIERAVSEYDPSVCKDIIIAHADNVEGAKELETMLLEKLPEVKDNLSIEYIGPIVGASVGPGTVAVYCMGKEVTFDSTKA